MGVIRAFLTILLTAGCLNPEKEGINSSKTGEDSLELLNREILEKPDNPEIYYRRALIKNARKEKRSALNDALRALFLDSNNCEYLAFAGLLAREIDLYVAESLSKVMLVRCPQDTTAPVWLLNYYVFSVYGGDVEGLTKATGVALTFIKNQPSLPRAYYLAGLIYKKWRDTMKAIEFFERSLAIEKAYCPSLLQLFYLYLPRDYQKARKYIDMAIACDSSDYEILTSAVWVYLEKEKGINPAKKIIQWLRRFYGDSAYTWYVSGIFAFNEGRYDSAITYFSKALMINDSMANAYYNRGVCYEVTGQKRLAEKDYIKCLKLEPQNEDAAIALSRVRSEK